ncbi:MAG: M24 family metallopeptidase [Rickettsiales bacterium]
MDDADTQERLSATRQYLDAQTVDAAVACAREAHRFVDEIIAYMRPGIRESDVRQFALDCFARDGIERTWHAPYVRFGENTLLTFREKATEDRVLGTSDIAFVDIGIVRNGIEGDAGRSVVYGEAPELKKLAAISQHIFTQARTFWHREQPTGIALYAHIYDLAERLGVDWNLEPAGHLIGAFPHRGWKRGINHYPERVEAGKWILEIQVRHKHLPYGAFFEDLLI